MHICPLKSRKLLLNISKCHKTWTALLRKQLFWPGMLSSPLVRVMDMVQRGIIITFMLAALAASPLLAGAMATAQAAPPGGPEATDASRQCVVSHGDMYPERQTHIVVS